MSEIYEFRPREDEPAVRNAELAEIVRLAREQPEPALTITAEDVSTRWRSQNRRQRWTLAAMVAAAVAMVATYVGLRPDDADAVEIARLDTDASPMPGLAAGAVEPSSTSVVRSSPAPEVSLVPEAAGDTGERVAVAAGPDDAEAQRRDESPTARLSPGVQVRPTAAGEHPQIPNAVVVRSTWAVEVAAGSYEVTVPVEAERSLSVRVQERTLEVRPGSRVSVTADGEPSVEVFEGRADWSERDDASPTVTAASLARRAERQMARGRAGAAISTLRRLVRRFPGSPAAKAGLLDLARLQRAAGQHAQARCAYETFLKRWPTSRLRRDVERAMQRLDADAVCPKSR